MGGYPAAAAMLPAAVLAEYYSISEEALPMPMPRRRKRGPVVHALDSKQEHSIELQEVLARSGHLLQRPTLRKLVARILDDPGMLPDGLDGDDDFDGMLEHEAMAAL